MIQTNEQTQIEQVLVAGDLAKLTGDQRLAYYQRLCETLGKNRLVCLVVVPAASTLVAILSSNSRALGEYQ